jgi:hypothetical protein
MKVGVEPGTAYIHLVRPGIRILLNNFLKLDSMHVLEQILYICIVQSAGPQVRTGNGEYSLLCHAVWRPG